MNARLCSLTPKSAESQFTLKSPCDVKYQQGCGGAEGAERGDPRCPSPECPSPGLWFSPRLPAAPSPSTSSPNHRADTQGLFSSKHHPRAWTRTNQGFFISKTKRFLPRQWLRCNLTTTHVEKQLGWRAGRPIVRGPQMPKSPFWEGLGHWFLGCGVK